MMVIDFVTNLGGVQYSRLVHSYSQQPPTGSGLNEGRGVLG